MAPVVPSGTVISVFGSTVMTVLTMMADNRQMTRPMIA